MIIIIQQKLKRNHTRKKLSSDCIIEVKPNRDDDKIEFDKDDVVIYVLWKYKLENLIFFHFVRLLLEVE